VNHHVLFKICLVLVSLSVFVGCTQSESGSNSGSITDSIADAIDSVINQDTAAVSATKDQIAEIKDKLNQDSAYALTDEDVALLQNEGVLASKNEIKEWVK